MGCEPLPPDPRLGGPGHAQVSGGLRGHGAGLYRADGFWLALVAPRLYRPVENVLLTGSVRAAPAIAFYILYIAGLVFLAVRPALTSGRASEALINGAVFGLVAYATFALTNHAVMKSWTTAMMLSDMTWGAVASGLGCTAGFFVARWLAR